MNEKRITVQWDAGRTSQNVLRGMYPQHQAEVIREAVAAGFRGWLDSGKPIWRERVEVDIIVRKAKAMDEGNLCGACKGVTDGALVGRHHGRMFLPAALPDDSPEWFKIGKISQEISPEWRGREQIVFVVRPCEGEP
jgi:hypothetical protein